MPDKRRQLVLNVFLTSHGHHPGGWRLDQAPGGGDPSFAHWLDMVRTAERGKLDAVFFADFVGSAGSGRTVGRRPAGQGFEPLTIAGALAAVTERIGIVVTANTNFNEPYNLARYFASLDHLTGGRIGWNVVSSLSEGSISSFGVQAPLEHGDRYARAEEFIDVARQLWDSWEDGAFDHPDKGAAVFVGPGRNHPVHHRGRFFQIDAQLDIARPVQGYPVFVQAGNSDTGREFAARHAEMIYASAQSLPDAQAYYRDVKSRMAKYGRDPDHLKVTPGLSFYIGDTRQEAQDQFDALQEAVSFHRPIELWGHDLSDYPLDGPLPDLPEPANGKGRWQQLVTLARRENLTIRQLILRFSVVRGHRVVIGTPASIAEQIEEWFVGEGADGFNLIPPLQPDSLRQFVDKVVPELQRRGIFRHDYEGRTLREHLGLPRPANQHGLAAAAAAE
ncbi:alkanesulfonate monooxygenase [Sphingomonas zeicaulis]|uniref:LLM class flavin-dependent oxidoreductase n=1 Tax=Sphingomonas zeicaulis TaxID=1632740 RepID=UPI003D1F0CDD